MKTTLLAALAAVLAGPALAQDITVADAYARSASASAVTGAAFFVIENHAATDDRLIEARSPAAERVEIHTHLEDANGVMRMTRVEDGIAVPAGGSHALMRGGDHVMFLGLTAPFLEGETVPLTLVFEHAGEVVVEVPVDLTRQDMPMPMPTPMDGGDHMNHGG